MSRVGDFMRDCELVFAVILMVARTAAGVLCLDGLCSFETQFSGFDSFH